jgi:DNA-binding response OmpR family regulator
MGVNQRSGAAEVPKRKAYMNSENATNGGNRALAGTRVLVLGDDTRMDDAVAALRHEGADVVVAKPVAVADTCATALPDAAIVEVTEPIRREALEALEWLRRQAVVPVLAVTEHSDVDARLRALRVGADDAVAPVAPREVVARCALLLFLRTRNAPAVRSLGDLVIDAAGRRVKRRGKVVNLTQRELQVLRTLTEAPGRVVSKEELLHRVWGDQQRSLNAVEAQISALRRKLHEIGPPIIHTAHGEGYVFRPTVGVDQKERSMMISERERLVREREEAVARRAKLLRQMEEQVRRSMAATNR